MPDELRTDVTRKDHFKVARLGKLLYPLCLAVAAVFAYSFAVKLHASLNPAQRNQTNVEQDLILPEEDVQLGHLYESGDYKHKVHITNPTDSTVTIESFERLCTCLNVTPSNGVEIGPGQTRAFELTLDLRDRGGDTSGRLGHLSRNSLRIT